MSFNDLFEKIKAESEKLDDYVFNKLPNEGKTDSEAQKVYKCIGCGAKLPYDTLNDTIKCEYCGTSQKNPNYKERW